MGPHPPCSQLVRTPSPVPCRLPAPTVPTHLPVCRPPSSHPQARRGGPHSPTPSAMRRREARGFAGRDAAPGEGMGGSGDRCPAPYSPRRPERSAGGPPRVHEPGLAASLPERGAPSPPPSLPRLAGGASRASPSRHCRELAASRLALPQRPPAHTQLCRSLGRSSLGGWGAWARREGRGVRGRAWEGGQP